MSSQPQFIMDDVKLLFNDLTTPETGVKFNPALRANPATIQNNIYPPKITWTWADEAARQAEADTQGRLGKYGIQTDANILFQLTSVSPLVWQPIQIGPTATWTWANLAARTAQAVTRDDIAKIGVQTDINTLYQLTNANPPIWQPVPNPTNTSSPFELSTGAADADSYHDFFRLQIAFEDVWAELLDGNIPRLAEHLYKQWDALMERRLTDHSRFPGPTPVWHAIRTPKHPHPAWTWANETGRLTEMVTQDDVGKYGLQQDKNAYFKLKLATDAAETISSVEELKDFIAFLKGEFGITGAGTDNSSSPTPPLLGQVANALADVLDSFVEGKGTQVGPWPPRSDDELLRIAQGLGYTMRLTSNQGYWDILYPNGTALATNLPTTTLIPMLTDLTAQREHTLAQNLRAGGAGADSSAPSDSSFLEINAFLQALDRALGEKYRFDIFAPNSINYGLLVNYRQHWQPQSYQVGNLVSTIPLAPQETRRYTTKTVIKKTRNVKEIDDSLRSGKGESSDTWRVDSEIVDRAKNQTNFQKNASGSFGNDNLYKVSAGVQQGQDQAVESAQTKREFHESVVKSAQEYRNQHRLEITTEESREDESTSYREIRNSNDELTVTYLFYELQRRYLVDEALHKVTPVILVANDVPAPHEVDQAWILRHDWVLRRTILDDSFLPALDYLSSNYTGAEVTLKVLALAVEDQRVVVQKISQQVQAANDALNAATLGLERTETQDVQALQQQESLSFVKSFFDPLGLTQTGKTNGNSDRARVDFAKDAMNRAQSKVNQMLSQLKTETTALQVAIDKYTKAVTEHFNMLADIDRLRVHIKDNIIYYMQAIWTYEPADQRYFRLYNLNVPVFTHNTKIGVSPTQGLAQIDDSSTSLEFVLPPPTLVDATMKLHQVADLENLIGFKGNYMIFPMVTFNYMTWFMMQNYLHLDTTGVTAQDPDPLAGLAIDDLKATMATIYARDPGSFEAKVTVVLKDGTTKTVTKQEIFEEIMLRLLSNQDPEMVIVPSNSLYIEALPGTHPLLEDFKLIHRAIDVKKVQAEARHAELENLRLAGRLAAGEYGDPDIDKVVVVGSGQNVTVDAGQ